VQQAQTRASRAAGQRVSVVLVIGLFSFIMCIDVILGRSEADYLQYHSSQNYSRFGSNGSSWKMLLTSSKAGGDNGVGDIVKENFEVKAITIRSNTR